MTCSANQWAAFYMLGISVIKELNIKHSQSWHKKAINRRSGVGLLSAVSSIDNGSTFCKKRVLENSSSHKLALTTLCFG